MNKHEINKRLIDGDPLAFEGIFKLTHARLLSYCKLFIPDHAQADDLVQECFLDLWEKRTSIKVNQSVESFLFVMLRHKCLNYIRDNKFLHAETNIRKVKEIDLQHLFELDFTGVENISIEEELVAAIKKEIDKLPQKRKEVFIQSKIVGLKNREVANELNISIKAVEKHLKLAKEQIRKELLAKYPILTALIVLFLK